MSGYTVFKTEGVQTHKPNQHEQNLVLVCLLGQTEHQRLTKSRICLVFWVHLDLFFCLHLYTQIIFFNNFFPLHGTATFFCLGLQKSRQGNKRFREEIDAHFLLVNFTICLLPFQACTILHALYAWMASGCMHT